MPWIGALIGGAAGLIGNSMNSGGSVQNSVPPEFSNLAGQAAQRGEQLGNLPYNPYPYSQVADFNPYQYMGFDATAGNAMGNPLPGQAQQALSGQLQGQNRSPVGFNPYTGAQTQVGQNPYAGSNPYLEGVIGNTLGDMSNQFNMNVAPTEAANALHSGSFGNSGLAQRADQNRYDLAKAMGQTAGNLRFQDYTGQQGLAENAINRGVSAQQTDLGRNAGLMESMFGRGQNAFAQNQAGLFNALGQAPSIYGLGGQPGADLQGIGSTMQQQGQNVLNSQYGQFQEAQNWPFKTYQAMLAPFGQNIGSQQTTSGGGNPVAGIMGGAMLGRQVQGGMGAPAQYNAFGGRNYAGGGTPMDQWSGAGYY